MKNNYLSKKRKLFVLSLIASLFLWGSGSAWAQKALPYSYGFEDYNLDTDGWTKYFGTSLSKNNNECAIVGDAKKTGSYGFRFSSANTNGANAQYLISPELNGANGVNVSFYYKSSNTGQYGTESFKVGYSTTDTDVSNFTWDEEISTNAASWLLYENSFPAGTKYVAIYYYSNWKYRLYVDDFSFTAPANGPALTVADGLTTINSGYNYNFGLATPGTVHYFTLSNPGTESITLNIEATNGFSTDNTKLTLDAKASVLLHVIMGDATSTGTVTITPTASGIDPFVINVSGTVADPNKVFETLLTGSKPEDWTTSGTWSWSTTNGASNTAYYESSNYRIITPKLNVADGESFFFDARGTYNGYQGVKFEYSADGTNWTASSTTTTLTSNWQTFTISDIPAGQYYIALHGWQCNIRNFYGGELPIEPKMVVTQPTSLNFGVITEPTQKTFTIANTGKATLEGINITSSNPLFTISDAPTSLAAGASQEVTITMAATTIGALSSDITVSATGMTDVHFTVTGTILPTGLSVIDFNDNQLPARWENTGWTFVNGAAYAAYHNPAYVMTTPKIVVNDGDMFVIKGKIDYDGTAYYVTVKGLNSNNEEVYSKKLTNDVFNNTDYTAVLLSDIPATVEKLQFVGYYGRIDEIQGINYAADLVVTTGDPAVTITTPAAYDFGEAVADAAVTYNFANAGAGTINITNVAITGEGAAAYSTNWTESVSAPFDLVITRTYDANRAGAGAQEATVTVTTSDGNFVINVTGTDKAANAPELAVSTNAIDFGKVTANAVETVTVTNNGTGSMTVNINSDSEDFEVSTASLTEIGAGESKTFDITFKFGTPYGVKNANITVTPTYDATAAETITVTGKAKDPATWTEDFDGNTLPTGWNAGSNWTIADGKANAAYSYGSTTYLTTPTLTVSGETDELTFDYAATANYVSIKIQKSKDGAAFTDLYTISGLNNGNTGSYTITGLEAGEYQFRFANDDFNLDNFEGFVLNLPDHMVSITNSNIPSSGIKVGMPFSATVTISESRGLDEEVTAKLYVKDDPDDEEIGSVTETVSAHGTKQLTIVCTPTLAADDVEMYIVVTYAGGTLTTDAVTRDIEIPSLLQLDEESTDEIPTGSSNTFDLITMYRTYVVGWNTIVLPLSTSLDAFGADAIAYEFTGYEGGELRFAKVTGTTLNPATPYLLYLTDDAVGAIQWENKYISSMFVGAENIKTTNNGVTFQGTYAPIAAGGWIKNDDSDNIYGITTDGRIAKAGASASMKGFRAYFDVPSTSAIKGMSLYDGDDATSIHGIALEGMEDGQLYDLSGRRVNTATTRLNGIYILNGKKVLFK